MSEDELQINKPLFIIGNNRSGTSLLRLIITCHENMVIPPEGHFLLWMYDKYSRWKENDDLNLFLDDLYKTKKFETWNIDKNELYVFLKEKNPLNYANLIAYIYIFYGLKIKKNIKQWGDKNGLWIEKLKLLPEIYPNAKYIHIIRDGRDVATSYLELNKKKPNSIYYPKLPNDIEEIAILWSRNINYIKNFLHTIPNGNFIKIKYEDLVINHEIEIAKVMNFLDLPLSNNVFNYYNINQNEHYEPDEFLYWKKLLNMPPQISNIGKYKYLLSKDDISVFNKIAKKELERNDYES